MRCQSSFTIFDSQDYQSLYQFLAFCQQQAIAEQQPKFASVAVLTGAIDPLAALSQLASPNQPHFYLEHRSAELAIAAAGSVSSHQFSGADRFGQAQQAMQTVFRQTISQDVVPTWLQPRCFSSFTFFDRVLDRTQANFPGPTDPALVHSTQTGLAQTDPAPQAMPAFAPATVFLPQWQMVRSGDRGGVLCQVAIGPQTHLAQVTQQLQAQLGRLQWAAYPAFDWSERVAAPIGRWQIRDPQQFRANVSSALTLIHQGRLDKLVLAEAIEVCSPVPFQGMPSLHRLRQLYPDCAVFSVGNGRQQQFIGASPERLLSLDRQFLTTDALAGSAPRGKTIAEDASLAEQLLGSAKERQEHDVVVQFMVQQLTQLGLQPQVAPVPTLRQLSHIQHLHTPIAAIVPSGLHPLEILAALHPTPAVAGLPRAQACAQIQQHETFERSLYAAPIGWVDRLGNAEFLVGIRSALLEGNRATLYAGAGIVAGSDPDREVAEVKLKLQTLLRGLI